MDEFIANTRQFLQSEQFHQMLITWGGRLLLALVVFVVGRWVAKALVGLFRRAGTRRELDPTVLDFLATLLYALLLLTVIIAALSQAGLKTTSLIAVLGAAGLAIGLALKDSLSNFAAGVLLIMFRPFGRGDFVEVGDQSGNVREIKIFSTILTTPDNVEITIPNNQVFSDAIKNYTANDQRRIDLMIGVSYDDDLKKAREVMERVVSAHEKVLDEPAINIFVHTLGDSSVNFAVRPWVNTPDYWEVRGNLMESIKVELEAAGCSIPYPQRDVHLFRDSEAGD